MRYLRAFWLGVLILLVVPLCAHYIQRPATSTASDPRQCSSEALQGYYPASDEVASHQQFSIPTIKYGFADTPGVVGSLLTGASFGFTVTLKVDASGKVNCYEARDDRGVINALNGKRREVINQFMRSRFTPFQKDKQPVTALVSVVVSEERSPLRRIDLPTAPQGSVHIGLSRTGCFGRCPIYSVEVYGDGRLIYTGDANVDVTGRHVYAVSQDAVAKLIEEMRTGDLWSMAESYDGDMTGDMPRFTLMLEIGGAKHFIRDRYGSRVGMPAAIAAFEESVDHLARSQMWIQLSHETIEQLAAEKFDFRSPAGGDILARAMGAGPGKGDEQAMRDLIARGVPIDSRHELGAYPFGQSGPTGSVLELAMKNRRASLIEPLTIAGALRGGPDIEQAKLDAAFQAAIVGGDVGLVQKAWGLSSDGRHPSLSYEKTSWDSDARQEVHRRAPVALLLEHKKYDPHAWDGLRIIRFLVEKGCDIKATGADRRELRRLAKNAGDSGLLAFLDSQGVS